MSRKILSLLLVCILSFSVVLSGCSGAKETFNENEAQPKQEGPAQEQSKEADKELVVGFVFVGPVGDGGWSDAHNNGRLVVEDMPGVKTIYKESVPEGPESEKVMKDMIDQGAKVIFATSFGYMDYVEKVAKEYPEVKFLHCSGYKMGENMSNYFGRIYEARYLSGIAAGLKSKSNKIGYVAAYEIPEVIRGINAFTQGVRSVNPDAKVVVRWTHTWYDPVAEKNAAVALLDEGADVIAQHQDTTGPQIAAEEKGAFAIGYNTDSRTAAPKAYITAPIWNWGPYYVKQVQAVIDGNWKSESYWEGMNDGIVDLAPLTENAPEGAKEKIDAAAAKIKDGSLKVFGGPIKDQTGAVKIAEGQAMSDEEMLSFDWFVEGVEGKIEKK